MNKTIISIAFYLLQSIMQFAYGQSTDVLDSLKERDKKLADSIVIQKTKIDSLERTIYKNVESIQYEIDSLNKVNDSLKQIMLNYTHAIIDSLRIHDSLFLDDIQIQQFKPGYYYRKLPRKRYDEHYDFYNEMEWIYVSKNNQVRIFMSANYEYCLLDMYFADKPKQIHKQIKKNYDKFVDLYTTCFGTPFILTDIISEGRIALYTDHSDKICRDEIIFVDGGLVRKIIDNKNEFIRYDFEYVGK